MRNGLVTLDEMDINWDRLLLEKLDLVWLCDSDSAVDSV